MKARSRERDEERLQRGEITPQEIQRENLLFRGFRKGVIGLGPKDKIYPRVRFLLPND